MLPCCMSSAKMCNYVLCAAAMQVMFDAVWDVRAQVAQVARLAMGCPPWRSSTVSALVEQLQCLRPKDP